MFKQNSIYGPWNLNFTWHACITKYYSSLNFFQPLKHINTIISSLATETRGPGCFKSAAPLIFPVSFSGCTSQTPLFTRHLKSRSKYICLFLLEPSASLPSPVHANTLSPEPQEFPVALPILGPPQQSIFSKSTLSNLLQIRNSMMSHIQKVLS